MEERKYGGKTAAELRELAGDATSRPWAASEGKVYSNGREVASTWGQSDSKAAWGTRQELSDSRLIAVARNALPDLLARIEELEREASEARAQAVRLRDALERIKSETEPRTSRRWVA